MQVDASLNIRLHLPILLAIQKWPTISTWTITLKQVANLLKLKPKWWNVRQQSGPHFSSEKFALIKDFKVHLANDSCKFGLSAIRTFDKLFYKDVFFQQLNLSWGFKLFVWFLRHCFLLYWNCLLGWCHVYLDALNSLLSYCEYAWYPVEKWRLYGYLIRDHLFSLKHRRPTHRWLILLRAKHAIIPQNSCIVCLDLL